jgi:hypothetical protein
MDQIVGDVAAIVLSYRRAWNIGPIVAACQSSSRVTHVYVIDQGGEGFWLSKVPAGVVYLRRPNIGAIRRLSFSLEVNHAFYLGIDDDLLLSAQQVDRLVDLAMEKPTRMHGVWGQLVWDAPAGVELTSGIRNVEAEVDILNRAYFYTQEDVRRAFSLAADTGCNSWEEIGPTDDIFLSMGGEARPLCHDIGALRDCPTSNDPSIALWLQSGFEDARRSAIERIRRQRRQGF